MERNRNDAVADLLSCMRLSPRSLHVTVGCENFRVLTDDLTQTFMHAMVLALEAREQTYVSFWLVWGVVVRSCVLNSIQDALACVRIFVIHRDT